MRSILTLLLLTLSAQATNNIKPAYKNIFVSGVPTEKEMAKFKKQKGAIVLDVRSIDELGNCSEPASAAKLGLTYNRVNFEKKPEIDPKVMADIEKVVSEAGGKPILIFCQTGSRASAWLAIHLAEKEGLSKKEAFEFAKKVGLKDKMEVAVKSYFGL